jgi:hypothetical protein
VEIDRADRLEGHINRRDLLKGFGMVAAVAAGVVPIQRRRLERSAAPKLRHVDHAATALLARQTDQTSGLANLAHLDFLGAEITPPSQAGHSTYNRDAEPSIGVLWAYGNYVSSGIYEVTGGGTYDAATNTYGQGAYDADDISRAAVVYVRHWLQHGDDHSRKAAYQLLRGLTYLQTSTGPNAGNVVLWMQPDGSLNPTPTPPDSPNPSDSGPSYWFGRTIWALGEGYNAFRAADPAFAAFLSDRFMLCLAVLERDVLDLYGTYLEVNGQRTPAWLLVGGADASSEACLGLAAYAGATEDERVETALYRLASGIGEMASGSPTGWPFGAILPEVTDLSLWHAWADQMAGALVLASTVLGDPSLLQPALTYGAQFAPHMMIQGGPDNEWLPAPVAAAGQVSYGAYCIFDNLLLLSEQMGRAGYEELAAFAASWWFGNNVVGAPMYDPSTGVCFDGVSSTGVNMNSGAESTICALLGMIALDAAPVVAQKAMVHTRQSQISWQLVDAASGQLSGDATLVTPPAGTAESQWAGQYVELGPSGAAALDVTLPAADQYLVLTVFDRRTIASHACGTVQSLAGLRAGTAYEGGGGLQGDGAYPDELVMATGPATARIAAGSASLETTYTGDGTVAELNAFLVQPEGESLVLVDGEAFRALLRSFAPAPKTTALDLTESAEATVSIYDGEGRLVGTSRSSGRTVLVQVEPAGFSVVTGKFDFQPGRRTRTEAAARPAVGRHRRK